MSQLHPFPLLPKQTLVLPVNHSVTNQQVLWEAEHQTILDSTLQVALVKPHSYRATSGSQLLIL